MKHVEPCLNSINIVISHFDEVQSNLELAADYCEDEDLSHELDIASEAFVEFVFSFLEVTNDFRKKGEAKDAQNGS